jgi:hypothetical protein
MAKESDDGNVVACRPGEPTGNPITAVGAVLWEETARFIIIWIYING